MMFFICSGVKRNVTHRCEPQTEYVGVQDQESRDPGSRRRTSSHDLEPLLDRIEDLGPILI